MKNWPGEIKLHRTDNPFAATKGWFSRLGGWPLLPDGIPWPEHDGAPMAFLCQIAWAEIPESRRGPVPTDGLMLVFAAPGFRPQKPVGPEGGFRLILVDDPPHRLNPRKPPPALLPDHDYQKFALHFVTVPGMTDGYAHRLFGACPIGGERFLLRLDTDEEGPGWAWGEAEEILTFTVPPASTLAEAVAGARAKVSPRPGPEEDA